MVIIETKVFTKIINALMPDDQYRELQLALMIDPEIGDLIKESGGIRKVRWKLPGGGKRGGARIIYYWAVSDDHIYMLYGYAKNDQADLTKDQLKILKQIVEKW